MKLETRHISRLYSNVFRWLLYRWMYSSQMANCSLMAIRWLSMSMAGELKELGFSDLKLHVHSILAVLYSKCKTGASKRLLFMSARLKGSRKQSSFCSIHSHITQHQKWDVNHSNFSNICRFDASVLVYKSYRACHLPYNIINSY